MAVPRLIQLRGVEVHNLKHLDLDLPHRKLIVLCGVSGSGKSSLAFDTLYAEGQRRYIESFSAYTRQFLERIEKPAAERIDGIPPAIAVEQRAPNRSSRSTVATTTEANDYLRLLFARLGRVYCITCGREVRRDSSQSVADELARLEAGTRFLVTYPIASLTASEVSATIATLQESGFARVIWDDRTINLADAPPERPPRDGRVHVVVDRLTTVAAAERTRDSLETAFRHGGICHIWTGATGGLTASADERSTVQDGPTLADKPPVAPTSSYLLDGQSWQRTAYSNRFRCDHCARDYPEPDPRLLSFNHPEGACPTCEGFGNIVSIDLDLVIPNPEKTLRQGAIAPWNTPSYAHELEELLALSKDYGIPVDVPYSQLDERQRQLVYDGVPERNFGGLRGFFQWLERRKYKMHLRVFLSRWRSYQPCPACHGARLRPEALAVRIAGKNVADVLTLKVHDAIAFLDALQLSTEERKIARVMLEPLRARLGYLAAVGLGYLTLDRTLRTLSGGEAQRVALTAALGSSLVNMLYVLDEPSIGLHPRDTERLVHSVQGLRNRGNTVVVVEHDEQFIQAADQLVEIGPSAGQRGGQLVFQGTPEEILKAPNSLTGDYLAGRRLISTPSRRREPNHGWIRLTGALGHNLQNVSVEFPLGVLCVVTGVSGSGKSTLIEDTLYPAVRRRLGLDAPKPLEFTDLQGDGQLDDCQLVDQSPIGRSPRSNPVTYVKAFDEIRAAFAATGDAKLRNYTASHFSFNSADGRCATCEGDGHLAVDMQFLADVYMKCPQCHGRRYRREVLEIKYRGRDIADVLEMTVREAFTFFRGQKKAQTKLKRLMDVGLDYICLGQPANTLSGGEAQRLKLAGYLSAKRRGRCLFLLDEPTTGLHFADIVQLLDCFTALLDADHSLIVVEHNLAVIRAADHIIDLGPEAAESGGRIVATGTPEAVAQAKESITGRYLAASLAQDASAAEHD
ncbi:MAG: excinuclease ABC subunit UvrA [Planctomycetia bacterium]|nr:excinuclease ABC subunit UvrA [Planctomycetia bacterium]